MKRAVGSGLWALGRRGWLPWGGLLAAALVGVLSGCGAVRKASPAPVPSVAAPAPEPTALELERDGLAALQAGDRAGARARLERALEKDPKRTAAARALAGLAAAEGDLALAARLHAQALDAEPGALESLLALADLHAAGGRHAEATLLLEKGTAERPFEVRLLQRLAVQARLAGQLEKSAEATRRWLARTKDDPAAYANAALLALQQEQLPLAELMAAKALELAPKDPAAHTHLGLVFARQGSAPRALAQFQKALELEPAFAPALANVGALALAARDYAAASRAFLALVQVEPGNPGARRGLAWAYEGMRTPEGTHRTAEAAAEFERVLVLAGEDPDALRGLARAWSGELRDLKKAEGFLVRYLAVAPVAEREKAAQELAVLRQRIAAGAPDATGSGPGERAPDLHKAPGAPGEGGALLERVTSEAEKKEGPAAGQGADAPAEKPGE